MIRIWSVESDPAAQGRLVGVRPVAVLDIGSNSVRLVVYERHARALTVLFNEKSSCALGRGVAATGVLARSSVDKALKAIQRYALVCRLMEVGNVHIIATSATREASNGPDFVEAVETIMGETVRVLSGPEEAHFAALGVVAGMPDFGGVVGDLGGGSLELAEVADHRDRPGETHALGAIRLQDDSDMSPARAVELARERLAESAILKAGKARTFCAIGGTWRAMAKLHQLQRRYPLHMVQDYLVSAADIIKLCDRIVAGGVSMKQVDHVEELSGTRRELLPFGAAVMAEVLRKGKFSQVVFSAVGVREGYLYDLLSPDERDTDPLIQAAEEAALLRARAPEFARDLIAASGHLLALLDIKEDATTRRLREAACNLSDIGWRAHPDYRGEQSVDLVAFGSFVGLDHPGRAFLAQTLAIRYMGLKQKSANAKVLQLAGPVLGKRARLLGAFFRVAYPLAAAMPGILPRIAFEVDGETLVMRLPADLAFLDGERLAARLDQLAAEAGFKGGGISLA